MPRRYARDITTNHERWLVSYADFITLLFAFFVVMYSVSQVSETKYRVLSDTLTQSFGLQATSWDFNPIDIGSPSLESKPAVIPDGGELETNHLTTGDGAFDRTADLPQLSDLFQDRFADLIDDKVVQVHSNEFWLELELPAGILFESGDAEVTFEAESIFQEVADVLKGFDNPIQIEGFTDNIPINTNRFPSNWELSASRAAAIVKLLAEEGIEPERMAAVGYGEFQPVADNNTEEGRSANRRVAVMIARERWQRPTVDSREAVEEAVSPSLREESAPYPEPALQQNDSDSGVSPLIPLENPDAAANQEEDGRSQVERLEPLGDITPVETENGGLLFSSDPDLPRN